MSNTFFRFKRFIIHHDRCAMKVGTDGVLLGAWCSAGNAGRVLDIGCGSGLITLLVAQRSPDACIDGVEIDQNASLQALENVKVSPWSERIKIHCSGFEHFIPEKGLKYDLIVSNPPFFENSLLSPGKERSEARHTISFSYFSFFRKAALWLSECGIVSVIIAADKFPELDMQARLQGLNLIRKTIVRGTSGAEPKRVLAEWSFAGNQVCEEKELVIEKSRHEYTDDYIALTKEFYLNM